MDQLKDLPTWAIIGITGLTGITIWITRVFLHTFFFHPLARFPGPKFSALSNFNYSWSYMGGRQPYDILKLHERYGMSCRACGAKRTFFQLCTILKDIYSPRKDRAIFVKSDFYEGGNFADQASSIVSERNPERHSSMRKFLATAFSDRSLREQEGIVSEAIDKFISQVGERGNSKDGVDMTMWTNLLTFDIIGELAFGESFHGLETGNVHSWITVVTESMGQSGLSDFLKRFPIFGHVFLKLNPKWLNSLMDGAIKHQTYTIDLVKRRIHQKTNRRDFISYLLVERNASQISDIQLAAHASDFVIAGSETTATCLSTIIFYVSRDQRIREKLQQEIRSTFKSDKDINGHSTSSLKYLHAVCLEALRIFPPLALGLPRVVPEAGGFIDGQFVPEKTIVSTNPLASSLGSANFDSPWGFRPERWLGLSVEDELEASQPFSMGSRSCLGRGLAWLELRLTLAKLYYKYDLDLVDHEVDWHRDVAMHLLWVKPKLMTRVSPRAS